MIYVKVPPPPEASVPAPSRRQGRAMPSAPPVVDDPDDERMAPTRHWWSVPRGWGIVLHLLAGMVVALVLALTR